MLLGEIETQSQTNPMSLQADFDTILISMETDDYAEVGEKLNESCHIIGLLISGFGGGRYGKYDVTKCANIVVTSFILDILNSTLC